MQENTPRRFQDSVHLLDPFFEPSDIMIHAAAPSVLEAAYFAFIALDDFVGAVAEEWRVEIDEVYDLGFDSFEDF